MMENNFKVRSGSVSDRGLSEKRPHNEDSYLDMPEIGLFAVADGVGGGNAGEVASQMAVEVLSEAFASFSPSGDAEDRMRAAIQQANSAIHQMSSDIPQLATMATTLVGLHVTGDFATIGHVGDSRLYRVDEKGNLFRETRDHSVVEEEVRAGRLTREQADAHPSKNIIARALGAEPSVEVDIKTIQFSSGTSFLLCSDGITRHITDLEISQLLMSPLEPDEICHTMKSLCYERGAEDNLTAVVVRCGAKAASYVGEEDILDLGIPSGPAVQSAPMVLDEPARPAAPVTAQAEPGVGELGLESLSGQLSYSFEEQGQQLEELGLGEDFGVSAPVAPETESAEAQAPARKKSSADELDLLVYQGDGGGEGGSGNLLTYVGLIVIGAILGFGGAMLTGMEPVKQFLRIAPATVIETAPLTEMTTANIPFTAFENARRRVDENPQAFINNLAGRAEGAEDNYLLARAFAHMNKPEEAKIALESAKKQLASVSKEEQQMMATEIALLNAALANLGAFQQALPMLIQSMKAPAANTAANTPGNANAAANTKANANANANARTNAKAK